MESFFTFLIMRTSLTWQTAFKMGFSYLREGRRDLESFGH